MREILPQMLKVSEAESWSYLRLLDALFEEEIADGSCVRTAAPSDTLPVSVKVVVPERVALPAVGQFPAVTGITSCEKAGEELDRLIRVRAPEDIVAF